MSGICGVLVKRPGATVSRDSLDRMCGGLAPPGDPIGAPHVSSWTMGPVGLGALRSGHDSGGVAATTLDGASLAIAVSGNVYGADGPKDGADSLARALLDRYRREGDSFFERVDGDFSFALWDGGKEQLLVVTDRFRIHSVFYADGPDQLVFASRVGALLRSPVPLTPTVLPEAIVDVVASSAIPTPKTIYREVLKLPPASVLSHRAGATRTVPYWRIDFLRPSPAGEADLAGQLRSVFADGVRRRFLAEDSPEGVGTFLSGGIDSSTVTGVLQGIADRPLKSFSIGFGEPRFNEISYARISARAMGAENVEYFVVPRDVVEALPTVLRAFDEPFGNASAVPTYFCARLARDHGVSVLYAGDGGDELFGGNERYAVQQLFEYYSRVPRLARAILEPAVSTLAAFRLGVFVRAKKYIRRAAIPSGKRLTSYDFFSVVPLGQFLTRDFLAEVGEGYDPGMALMRLHDEAPARAELDRQLYLDLHLAISDNDLFKVTRMSEAAGVSVRFPFLDRRLAEFAMTVPASMKMRGRELRTFFKRAYADLLPSEVRTKSKHGFGLPVAQWLRTDKALADMMEDLVLGPRLLQRGYFRKAALEDLVRRHRADVTSFYGTTLWNLMILELWHRDRDRESADRAANSSERRG